MRKKLQAFLTPKEAEDLLRQPDRTTLRGKRDYAILLLLLLTGIRRDELCKLKKGDLKREEKKAWLHVWGKGGRQREIPIKSFELIRAIQRYWSQYGYAPYPDLPFFCKIVSNPDLPPTPVTWDTVRWVVGKYARLAKIRKNIHPHSLRHTFITNTLKESGDIVAVKALAGHSSIRSTEVYLHTDKERMERAIEKIGI